LPYPANPPWDDITSGAGYAVNEVLPELADQQHPSGRSLHQCWAMGDREVIKRWLATADERERAYRDWLKNDPELVELRRLRKNPKWPDPAERFE
jgi:hypothetical protein